MRIIFFFFGQVVYMHGRLQTVRDKREYRNCSQRALFLCLHFKNCCHYSLQQFWCFGKAANPTSIRSYKFVDDFCIKRLIFCWNEVLDKCRMKTYLVQVVERSLFGFILSIFCVLLIFLFKKGKGWTLYFYNFDWELGAVGCLDLGFWLHLGVVNI